MTLDTFDSADDLYLARGEEVNPHRPLFTGDVFADLVIPGVIEDGMAMIVAHPCTFRAGAVLADRVLVARVVPHSKQGPGSWRTGFYDRMPLPDVSGTGQWVGNLDLVGRAVVTDLDATTRIACLSAFGVNMLQQRLTFHLTRAKIPTETFEEAFSHTFEEAELLEEWTDALVGGGWTITDATTAFEHFLRSESPTWQERLKEAQLRSAVRRACRGEAARLLRNE